METKHVNIEPHWPGLMQHFRREMESDLGGTCYGIAITSHPRTEVYGLNDDGVHILEDGVWHQLNEDDPLIWADITTDAYCYIELQPAKFHTYVAGEEVE